MKKDRHRPVILIVLLSAVLMVGMPSWALAQCGDSSSGSGSSHHQQHMGSSGDSGSDHSDHSQMHGSQATGTGPFAVTPGYSTPAPQGYADPQTSGSTGSGHQGHTGN
ncbi:MAG: hypothetical protein M1438_12685 [Deltaproteobacteria bacterium]|nr:hypothetical protein [Deltaproteobacteria bacterium]